MPASCGHYHDYHQSFNILVIYLFKNTYIYFYIDVFMPSKTLYDRSNVFTLSLGQKLFTEKTFLC